MMLYDVVFLLRPRLHRTGWSRHRARVVCRHITLATLSMVSY